ncbi:hypothetical protein G7B40_008385 [Aetokthonos hydrillicola Thurmond2011]|uniref:Uncharacterized protein n=1 Tax=Aetokthonos hydrillicola Thurmond2011 TaxID=2712845 RepID=A0AAP5M6Z5_9CYAN|nr:hypothetical protein [Aetokthonos hydrillicola]MBO3464527.1 hypothetical protein [Aetokthonos hydrillicola CCALA 1050]MDR9894590.1 hypothetical protein [Aetokthonos hydrillicola Thurmond2011]
MPGLTQLAQHDRYCMRKWRSPGLRQHALGRSPFYSTYVLKEPPTGKPYAET